MKESIESFLSLTEEEVKRRGLEILRKIPTRPGIGYLRTRLKEFEIQPWPFIIYLAYNNSEVLKDALDRYSSYDGNENSQTIMEKLREYYILGRLAYSYHKI